MDDNAPVVPALGQAEQLEAMLEVAHRLSVEKRHIVAERDRVVAQHEHTIADRDRVITELRHAIAELQHTIAEHERVSTEQRRNIAEQEHTMARFCEQVQILATMAVPAARRPVDAPPRDNIPPGNGALTGNNAATTDDDTVNTTMDETATDDTAADDTASGAEDILDDADSDTDDAPRDGAPPRGASTGNDAAHTVAGSNTTARSGAGSSSAARTTATHSVAAPADEIGESAQLAKRRRVNHQARDGSDQDITSEHLLVLAHPFTLIDIDVLADIFKLVTRRRLIPEDVESGRFARELARLEGLTRWPPRLTKNDLPELATLNLLRCGDMDSEAPRQTPLQRLGLAEGQGAVVLGPVLCYILVTLCGIRLEQISGPVIGKIFKRWTGKSLSELTVATRYRVGQMSETDVSNLVRDWVQGLCTYITRDGGVERSLTSATQCNRYYMSQCPMDANGVRSDPTGNIAKEVLDGSSDCRLFLGLNEDLHNLEALCKRFFAIADGSVEQHT
ncbi:hypothetical protein GGI19_006114, partial [Coemansia pectinata]